MAAAPREVWAEVRDISSHGEWMHDAGAIRFTSAQRSGIGTTIEVDTKVGPFRLTDRMVVTEWEEGRLIGVRHVGVVTGTGRFTLTRHGLDATRFSWEEDLRFPWWMGGPPGGWLGALVLRLLWRRNLARLKRRVETR